MDRYLVYVMIMRRHYGEASRLLSNCFTDTPFTDELKWLVEQIVQTASKEAQEGISRDQHPDCIACRLKLAIVCYESGHDPSSVKIGTEILD